MTRASGGTFMPGPRLPSPPWLRKAASTWFSSTKPRTSCGSASSPRAGSSSAATRLPGASSAFVPCGSTGFASGSAKSTRKHNTAV